jgi:hypothetical protein
VLTTQIPELPRMPARQCDLNDHPDHDPAGDAWEVLLSTLPTMSRSEADSAVAENDGKVSRPPAGIHDVGAVT